ncbi:MAG: glycosyltransferase [Gemmatimonadales bacterium]
MRVLLFRSLCDTGGVSSWMQEHARELRRQGADPEFWFEEASVRTAEFDRIGRTTVGPMPVLLRRLERDPFDVVHVSSSDAPAELLTLLRPRPRIVASNRGALSDFWDRGNCVARTAVSRDMARLDQPFTDVLVEPILNGLDPTRFSPPADRDGGRPILAWVGRTTDIQHKDFPRFTRIVARLCGPAPRVWIADAHGADWSAFSFPPCERIEIERWSRVSHDGMPEFYRAVARTGGLVVMTSPTEGFGWVAVEAAACGAAVIAPDVVGLRETVMPGVTGALFPPGSADSDVARLVEAWLAGPAGDPAERQRRAEAARDAFSLETMTRRYLDVYQRRVPLAAPEPRPRHEPGDPALPILLGRLASTRRWRGRTLVNATRDLLDDGRTDLAARALRLAMRRVPDQLIGPPNNRRVARSAIRIAGRALRGRWRR